MKIKNFKIFDIYNLKKIYFILVFLFFKQYLFVIMFGYLFPGYNTMYIYTTN